MKAIADRVKTSAAVSFMDLSVEAEAFGSSIRFSSNEVPVVTNAIVESVEDVEALRVPEVGEGRTGVYVEYVDGGLSGGVELDPRMVGAYTIPAGMTMKSVPVQNAYDQVQIRIGEMLPEIFADKSLYGNDDAIWAKLHEMAKVVNDAYKEYDEYAE